MLALLLHLTFCALAPSYVTVAPEEDIAVYDSADNLPTVVLLPGLSGCAYGFRNLLPLLHQQNLRTVVIEPLGLGLSARPTGAAYTLTAQADRIVKVLKQREIEGAIFVAQGVSASMAMRIAYREPHLVAGIVSIEGAVTESAATATVQNGLKLAKWVAKFSGTRLLRDRYTADLKAASGDASWVDKRTVRQYFRGAARDIQGTLASFVAMSEQSEPEPLAPNLARIQQPVLVLRGGAPHTGALSENDIATLCKGLPDVTVQTIAGAGHFIYEEQPAAVSAAVNELRQRTADTRELQ